MVRLRPHLPVLDAAATLGVSRSVMHRAPVGRFGSVRVSDLPAGHRWERRSRPAIMCLWDRDGPDSSLGLPVRRQYVSRHCLIQCGELLRKPPNAMIINGNHVPNSIAL